MAQATTWKGIETERGLRSARLDALPPEERTEYFEDVRARYDAIEDPTDLPPRTLGED